mmetsp:Transcript_10812/g.30968  ORF Transcript_10812/g.30968 Transcript_10812/m.30968 type:complete len:644 (+) Transcript_10812:172-2103(+)
MDPMITEEEEARQSLDMLRSDDVSNRIAAANKLESIATALGEQRTREELLPFLKDRIDDEDEVLLAIAKSLGKMIPHAGGADHAHRLLPPLEMLLMVEENTVRDAASESTSTIADALPTESFQLDYSDMLVRLATKEWFTARISAAGLVAKAYRRLTAPQQEDALQHFAQLCRDDTPMVRRVAAQNLGQMLENVVAVTGRIAFEEGGPVPSTLIPIYEDLASNEQPDSVRLQTTENCVTFGRVMSEIVTSNGGGAQEALQAPETQLIQRLLPLVVATIDDRSWRVRWTAAAKFAHVISAFDALPNVMDSLVPAYERLLQDPEAEVRTAATFNLASVARCGAMVPVPTPGRPDGNALEVNVEYHGPRVTAAERLVRRVTTLTEDDSEHVRAALAMVATELAPIMGRDATITHLVPPILLLLRDAASEVRLNLISSLGALDEVVGVNLLSQSLLPAILDLAQDSQWRIRLSTIEHIPLLGRQLGQYFFTERLASICVNWLGDDIATIRTAAAKNLQQLTALFGTDWACETIIPAINEIQAHPSYLRRLTALQSYANMALEMDPPIATTVVIPMLLEMASDDVPNVRFNVAKELGTIAKKVCSVSVYETQLKPVLTLLSQDQDRDVRFYAEQSIRKLEEEYADERR